VASFFNPWAILAVVLAIVGAGGYGMKVGRDMEIARHAKEMTLQEKLQQTLAEEVSKIKVTNTTTRQTINAKTIEVPVYRDCRNDPVVVSLLNDILTGKATAPAGSGVVPAADPAH
jgi:hypothetical protein